LSLLGLDGTKISTFDLSHEKRTRQSLDHGAAIKTSDILLELGPHTLKDIATADQSTHWKRGQVNILADENNPM